MKIKLVDPFQQNGILLEKGKDMTTKTHYTPLSVLRCIHNLIIWIRSNYLPVEIFF